MAKTVPEKADILFYSTEFCSVLSYSILFYLAAVKALYQVCVATCDMHALLIRRHQASLSGWQIKSGQTSGNIWDMNDWVTDGTEWIRSTGHRMISGHVWGYSRFTGSLVFSSFVFGLNPQLQIISSVNSKGGKMLMSVDMMKLSRQRTRTTVKTAATGPVSPRAI